MIVVVIIIAVASVGFLAKCSGKSRTGVYAKRRWNASDTEFPFVHQNNISKSVVIYPWGKTVRIISSAMFGSMSMINWKKNRKF